MRVLLVAPVPPPYGGMALQARQLERLLTHDGVAVEVLASNFSLPSWLEAVERVLGALGHARVDVGSVLVAENVSATARVIHLEARDGHRLDPASAGDAGLLGDDVSGVTMQGPTRTVVLAGDGRVGDAWRDLDGSQTDALVETVMWRRSALSFFQSTCSGRSIAPVRR